jgi:hypothetical protein
MEPSNELRRGRRALEGLTGVELLSALTWQEEDGAFALRFRVTCSDGEAGALPPVTEWYALIEPTYPYGDISIVPARDGGITATYQHQRRNRGRLERSWRTGKICVQTPMAVKERAAFDGEPYEPEQRLRWNVERCRGWIRDASRGSLVRPGDPFELPDFPFRSRTSVMFSEGPAELAAWRERPERLGLAEYVTLSEAPAQLVVTAFTTLRGEPIFQPSWGTAIAAITRRRRGCWLRMDSVPVLSPWEPPETWGDLSTILASQKINAADVLRRLVPHIRDGLPHVALLGFAIPSVVDGQAVKMHWAAIELPTLSTAPQPGFRPTEASRWLHDSVAAFGASNEIVWAASQNWHPDELASRGRLDAALRSSRILLIGAGAVGAAISELLVRGGVTDILIVDGDSLAAGNLIRHTLTLREVGQAKARALADRLNAVSPHSRIESLAEEFPPRSREHDGRLRECDVVLDCTGSDAALHALSTFEWGGERLFSSFSVGLEARRMFIFTASAGRFPHAEFQHALGPWLAKERAEQGGKALPREGTGCWNAVFPAAPHEMGLMCAAAIWELERACAGRGSAPNLSVLERGGGDDVTQVLRRTVVDG